MQVLATATAPEIFWTFLGIIGFIVSLRGLYHARQHSDALKVQGLNGPRALVASRDIVRNTIYSICALLLIVLSGTTLLLYPNMPENSPLIALRHLFPWFGSLLAFLIIVLPINDEIARERTMALLKKEIAKAKIVSDSAAMRVMVKEEVALSNAGLAPTILATNTGQDGLHSEIEMAPNNTSSGDSIAHTHAMVGTIEVNIDSTPGTNAVENGTTS